MPPLRLAIIEDLAECPSSNTAEIRKRLNKPRATVDRQLQALHMLGVLDVEEDEAMHRGQPVTVWIYSIASNFDPAAINPNSVPEMSPHTPNPFERRAWGRTTY
jgi:predicted transcriptional regulator